MTPQRYRKRAVEVEAVQWDGTRESIDAICRWVNDRPERGEDPTISYVFRGDSDVEEVVLWTPEGDVGVPPNYWIIHELDGAFRALRPDLFQATYEPVEGDGPLLLELPEDREAEDLERAAAAAAGSDPKHVEAPVPEEAVEAVFRKRFPGTHGDFKGERLWEVKTEILMELELAAPFIAAKAVEGRDREIERLEEHRDAHAHAADARIEANKSANERAEKAEDALAEACADRDAAYKAEEVANRERDSLSESYARMKRARSEALRERDQAIERVRERLAKVPNTGGVVTVVDLEAALDSLDHQQGSGDV